MAAPLCTRYQKNGFADPGPEDLMKGLWPVGPDPNRCLPTDADETTCVWFPSGI
ncbi:MAG: hypothetical protein ACLUUJ_04095 [Acutalibacteraceae bacterium]